MRNRKLAMSLMVVGAMALVAWPVYAHCGKCAGDAKAMVTAMDAGKTSLGAAVTAAEAAAKGKAVSALAGMHDGKVSMDVYVVAGDKIMQVTVDGAGKAGAPKEVKEFPGDGHNHAEKKPIKGG